MSVQPEFPDAPATFDGEIAVARLLGRTRPQTAQAVTALIAEACAQRWPRLLIEISAGPELAVPSLAMRAEMVRAWAEASQGRVAVAIVCPPEFIDPHRFGVSMARNFGMIANVFVDAEGARDWLLHTVRT